MVGPPLYSEPVLEKPQAVTRAEWALWVWTAWTFAYGLYRTWGPKTADETAMTDALKGLVAIQPESLHSAMAAGYALMALSMVWVVFKIGDGKPWARGSLLLSFVIEALWIGGQSGPFDYVANVPDLAFQIYALYLLYTNPGRLWFKRTRAVT